LLPLSFHVQANSRQAALSDLITIACIAQETDMLLMTNHTIQSGVELSSHVKQLHKEASGTYAFWSTKEELPLDAALDIWSPDATLPFYLYFGVKNKPMQRLKLVCRNAATALVIR
jgi:hypothetical protein